MVNPCNMRTIEQICNRYPPKELSLKEFDEETLILYRTMQETEVILDFQSAFPL